MEFILSFLLLSLNLFDYEINLNKIVFFGLSTVIVGLLFYVVYKKNKDFLCTCVTLMCYTWPISWINIFGDSTEFLQLPWIYLLGAFIVINALSKVFRLVESKVNSFVLGVFVTLIVLSVYPLLISPSMSEGLKELLIIGFFIVLVFLAFLQSNSFDEKKRKSVIDAYIWTVAISSLFIILQTTIYLTTGEILFKYSVGVYFGKTMISAGLLMEDTSCATIMLGTGIFYMLERFNKKEKRILYILTILITVTGMAFTTRRTSMVSLVICFILYVPINYKGVMKKLTMFVLLSGVVFVMMMYLMIARPVDNYAAYLDSNGRLNNYIKALGIFVKNPLGVGYDNVHLLHLFGDFVPHNTILRWLNMAGIIFVILMMIILFYIVTVSGKKKMNDNMWAIIYCLIAMNFIPDILNARFFVIPCMMSLLCISLNNDPDTKIKLLKGIRQK